MWEKYHLDTGDLLKRLERPKGEVDVVIDTDTYNEIDDQFALAYLLKSHEKLRLQAIYAAPFFNHHSESPEDGMEKSFKEIHKVLGLLKKEEYKKVVFKGSRTYLENEKEAVESSAARNLVKLALKRDDNDPLYIIAIGAITNIASAILMEPSIIRKIVVIWLGGNALDWHDNQEFNACQDGSKGISGITFAQVSRTYQMNQIPNSLGGKNIGDDGYTAEGVINDKAWIDGATWYQELFNNGISLKGITADDAGDFFRAGKIVFIVDGTWMANSCDKEGMKDYAYAPVPAFEGHESEVGTPTGSWHFGIPKNAKNKELAAEFIKFMSIGEGNSMWLEANGDVPATVAGVETMMKSDKSPEYMKIAAYESANTAVPRAMTPGYTEYDTIIQNTWEDIKNGSDVSDSLKNAVNKIEKVMEKYNK